MLRLDANHCIQLSNWVLKTEFRLLSLVAIFPSPRQLYKAEIPQKKFHGILKYCVSQPFAAVIKKSRQEKT